MELSNNLDKWLGLTHVQWYGILLLVIGAILSAFGDRMNFYHRREIFSSRWSEDKLISFIVGTLRLLATTAFFFGFVLLVVEYANAH